MLLILHYASVGLACEPYNGVWLYPQQYPRMTVGTNTLLFGSLGADIDVDTLTDNETRIMLHMGDGSVVPLDSIPVGDSFSRFWVARPIASLEPESEYVLTLGQEQSQFSTGSGPAAPPDAPVIVGQALVEETLGCGYDGPMHRFDFRGVGAFLVADLDGTADVSPDAPLDATGAEVSIYMGYEDGRDSLAYPAEQVGKQVRFGLVDSAGQWSGWTEVEPIGCGCSTSGWASSWTLTLLGTLGFLRRGAVPAPRASPSGPRPSPCSDDSAALPDPHFAKIPVGPNNPVREQLIVMLHGSNSRPSDVEPVLSAFAQAGFRTIGLAWNGVSGTTREQCLGESDDADYNDCLEYTRDYRLTNPVDGIVPQLVALLNQLALDRPFEGWDTFLDFSGQPAWNNVILAGHSEGANDTAFAMRRLSPAPHGVILMSGGGDLGTLVESTTLADWMTQELDNPHVVGLRHAFETYSFNDGWDRNGMPPDTVTSVEGIVFFYDDFLDAHRLIRADLSPFPGPHGSTAGGDIREVHMYLACKAASG